MSVVEMGVRVPNSYGGSGFGTRDLQSRMEIHHDMEDWPAGSVDRGNADRHADRFRSPERRSATRNGKSPADDPARWRQGPAEVEAMPGLLQDVRHQARPVHPYDGEVALQLQIQRLP